MAAATSIEAVFKLVRDSQTVERSQVAAIACLVYDIFITLDQEVDYIWKSVLREQNGECLRMLIVFHRSRWTIPKYLYLWGRYFALFIQIVATAARKSRINCVCLHPSPQFISLIIISCAGWSYFEGITGQMLVMGIELLLMLRVWALYKRDRRILYMLVALYVAEVTANTVILGVALPRFTPIAPLHSIFPPGFPLSGCLPIQVPRFFFSYWIPVLLFESILFILMLINFVRLAREHAPMPLLKRFFRDGTVYYAVIFAALLVQVLLYELVNSALAQVAIG
ncbi:hypothetical protein BD410DRAFT_839241 [Rickenella mellea]|uniref:DUF6533 domain-containing protein n=1 Tax=Rickenella mellea TaxID=50990 RepID=A0A4Y7Q6F4_9AGAM|nr:hypothetical protein BD410DRAFT_839241 [Rickenella mellea]